MLLHVFVESYSSDTEIGVGTGRLLDATREDAEVAHLEKLLRAELKAGLIVMASHCYGWFDRLIHGSDAEAVLRQASLPSADGEGCLVGAVAFLILEAFIGFVPTLQAQTSRSGLVR